MQDYEWGSLLVPCGRLCRLPDRPACRCAPGKSIITPLCPAGWAARPWAPRTWTQARQQTAAHNRSSPQRSTCGTQAQRTGTSLCCVVVLEISMRINNSASLPLYLASVSVGSSNVEWCSLILAALLASSLLTPPPPALPPPALVSAAASCPRAFSAGVGGAVMMMRLPAALLVASSASSALPASFSRYPVSKQSHTQRLRAVMTLPSQPAIDRHSSGAFQLAACSVSVNDSLSCKCHSQTCLLTRTDKALQHIHSGRGSHEAGSQQARPQLCTRQGRRLPAAAAAAATTTAITRLSRQQWQRHWTATAHIPVDAGRWPGCHVRAGSSNFASSQWCSVRTHPPCALLASAATATRRSQLRGGN